jgi:7-carboxy-7-deazaguanine synthase
MSLYVNEIFYFLQGETSICGFPSLFIRLAGCNLDCVYCDTAHAKSRDNSKLMSIKKIMKVVEEYSYAHHITITGGEPLIQKEISILIQLLCDEFPFVQVETNGSISIAGLDRRAMYIVDIKTPSSGQIDSFNFENIELLKPIDEVKFVIADDNDYVFAKAFIFKHLIVTDAAINFSPAFGLMDYLKLANKILKDGLDVRLNVPLHKVIGLR